MSAQQGRGREGCGRRCEERAKREETIRLRGEGTIGRKCEGREERHEKG